MHCGEIMPVDVDREPPERLELRRDRFGVHDLLDRRGLLKVVVVHDQRQVRQLELHRGHRGLPHLTLLDLAVTGHDEDVVVLPIETAGERVPDADRESLAERSRGGLDAGDLSHVGMTLKWRSEFAEAIQLRHREVAGLGEDRVQQRRGMALGKDEAVTVGPVRLLGVVAQNAAEEERDRDLDA